MGALVKGWSEYKMAFNGVPILGILDVKYQKEVENELLYGAGNEPIDYGNGNRKYTGSIKFYRYEIDRILSGLAPGKDLTDIAPFPITHLMQFEGSSQFQTDVVLAKFTSMGRELKQGDQMDTIELKLCVLGIKFNV